MNVTEVGRRRSSTLVAAGLGLVGLGLLVRSVVAGSGLEVVLVALGLVAASALVTLLTD